MKSPTFLFLLPVMALALTAAPATPSNAGHSKVARESSFMVALPAAEAFTLFEPLGEKKWAEGWNPIFASEADVSLHDGSVFTVDAKHPKGGLLRSVWTISRYEPPALIEYRNIVVDLRATRIRVTCFPAGSRATTVTVNYEYTALNRDGDEFISQMTVPHFKEMIGHWSESIAAYLKRGTPATP